MIPPDLIPLHLIDKVANQDVVFFCGAGISRGLEEDEQGFLGGRELARKMAEKLLGRTVRDNEPLNLKQIAQEVIWKDKGSRNRLNEYLREVFEDPKIKPLRAHKALANLECNVITTNYDTLIEDAFKQAEKRCGKVAGENDLTRMRDVNVVKIHGCITDVDNIVIAEEDYYRWLTSDSEMKALVRLWFLQYPIVFIGFSLSDPNFRQLYYDLRLRFGKALKKAYAIFKERSDNYDMRFIESQKIEIIKRDATAFLDHLEEQVVIPRAFEKHGAMDCARIWGDWIDADPKKRTQKDLEKLVPKHRSRVSDILTLLDLPDNFQQLLQTGTIQAYMAGVYIQRILVELDKRGELEERKDEVYEWAQTGPSQREAQSRYELLRDGKGWSELERKE